MLRSVKIAGFPLPLYLGILAILYICMRMGCLPGGIVGGLLILMVVGEGLNTLGKTIPIIRTYLGGSVACILGGAILTAVGFSLFPHWRLRTASSMSRVSWCFT